MHEWDLLYRKGSRKRKMPSKGAGRVIEGRKCLIHRINNVEREKKMRVEEVKSEGEDKKPEKRRKERTRERERKIRHSETMGEEK